METSAALLAGIILSEIVAKEGAGALFKGALPRACWVAPLGAMNFAGYELSEGRAEGQRRRGCRPAACRWGAWRGRGRSAGNMKLRSLSELSERQDDHQ